MAGYANPEVLVSIEWLKSNLNKPGIRVVEVDVEPKHYEEGHIQGAIGLDWGKDLQDQVRRDIPDQKTFEALVGSRGIKAEDTVILYGDSGNWFAAYAFWLFKVYGHADVRLLNGGRSKWLSDQSLAPTTQKPAYPAVQYRAQGADARLRAYLAEARATSDAIISGKRNVGLVDVRSPDEFTGKIMAPPGLPETAQRSGHIPGAVSVPWMTAVNQDGTFRSPEELKGIYIEAKGLSPQNPTIAYCRIGERSSHTWFVLKYLLGFKDVKNYDGSWTEYGSVIGVPIEKTAT